MMKIMALLTNSYFHNDAIIKQQFKDFYCLLSMYEDV